MPPKPQKTSTKPAKSKTVEPAGVTKSKAASRKALENKTAEQAKDLAAQEKEIAELRGEYSD